MSTEPTITETVTGAHTGAGMFLLSVRPAVGQPWRTTTVYADAASAVAAYAARRWGNGFTPVLTAPRAGEWHVFNGVPGGRALTAYAVILADFPSERARLGVPTDAPARVVMAQGVHTSDTVTADGRTWGTDGRTYGA